MAETSRWAVYANSAPVGHRMPAECWGPDAKANAKLIAAAPALADALELSLKHMMICGESDGIVARVLSALRAAGRIATDAPKAPEKIP